MADSTGQELTYGRALVASLLLSRLIRRHTTSQPYVGLLLPASVGGALANIAASIAGKIPVNLNFTAGQDAMNAAIARCGITTVLTSRRFLSKAGIDPLDGMVYLEDLLGQMSTATRARMWLLARALPAAMLERAYVAAASPDAPATVIFSSGSTGVPKGVVLTHGNILANVAAVNEAFPLTHADVMLGVLPFFHSFGFTGTLWFPVITGFGVVYHPNPMDAKTIGELAQRYRATLMISTPTFCSSYVRKCQTEQFASLRYAIVGAEKLRPPIAAAFKDKFGLDLLEGYGCTEMSPIVSVNLPERPGQTMPSLRPGTVGRPLPGVEAMVVDLESGKGPLIGVAGLLLLIATIDEDGFIRITDRVSRFSKIAGEMVPHMKIEQQIQELLDQHYTCVVTAVPDTARGERIVAFYTDPALTSAELWDRLCRTELPRLWLPKREDLRSVDAIPTLGTGKIDLRAVRQLAIDAADQS
jgi:acyl-[acyl-carrier-protein]-phospholipid O-acyltransferase/long-chain-fatty-acid--[acyl-carrier-protein] ligase